MSATRTKSFSPERIRYFQGQKLSARDLRDTIAYETRLHGMHLRGLHDTWGVALGFELSVNTDRDMVLIGPGVAYDCHGRAIISSRVVQAEMPPLPKSASGNRDQSWVLDLVIAYGDDPPPLAQFSCPGDGPSPTEEIPAWRWVFAGTVAEATPELAEEVRLGEEVPLARFVIRKESGFSDPDFSHRRSAQGLVRPHVGGGQHKGSFQFSQSQLAFTIPVDTSAAGFTTIPHYFATLEAHPFLRGIDENDPEQVQILRYIQGPFLSIRNPLTTSFDLDVRFAFTPGTDVEIKRLQGALPSGNAFLSLASSESAPAPVPVTVNWHGVEDVGGCMQPLTLIIGFMLPFIQLLPVQIFLVTDD